MATEHIALYEGLNRLCLGSLVASQLIQSGPLNFYILPLKKEVY